MIRPALRYVEQRLTPDYVGVHPHAVEDVQGLPNLFPPSQVVDGVVVDPNTNSAVFVDLDDMQVTVRPPSGIAPLWECRLWFDGQFNATDSTVGVRIVEDPAGTPVELLRRATQIRFGPRAFLVALTGVSVVSEGADTTFGVQWRSVGAAATAVGTRRHLIATLRPFNLGSL